MRRWGFPSLGLIALLIAAAPAQAQFPGANGRILFTGARDANGHVLYTVGSDGTGLAPTGEVSYSALDPFGHGEALDQFRPSASPADGEFVYVEWHVEGDDVYQNLRFHSGPVFGCYGSPDNPAWSPDARLIAYDSNISAGDCESFDDGNTKIQFRVLAGSGPGGTLVNGRDPDWSPDGTRIAYEAAYPDSGVWTMNPNGTGKTRVTDGFDPSWSPDGSKILVSDTDGSDREIYAVNRDGTGRVALTSSSTNDEDPVWSPDGTKIVFTHHTGIPSPSHADTELWVMNADGSGAAALPTGLSYSLYPSWRSLPIDAYPRPKAATSTYFSLVPAYATCASPNRVHATPLSHDSCAPPQQSSGRLTVGTPDANSSAASSIGSVRLKVLSDDTGTPADEADVVLDVNVTDVRRQSDLSDYAGELRVGALVRATDKLNQPSPIPSGLGAATSVDLGFGPPVPCTATPDPAVGSICALATTVDALIPGLVVGGGRSNWQFQEMRVFDGGPDEDGDTTADNTVFLTQGLFVP